jgi:hypothetical protein
MNDIESSNVSEKTEETVASLAGMSGFVVEGTDVLPTFQQLKTDEVDEAFKSVIEVTDRDTA